MRTLFIGLMITLGVVHTGLGGTEAKTLVHGRRTRSYRVHIPPSYRQGHPVALVFALHGHGNTAAGYEKTLGFNPIADREGFIVVYPNAVAYGLNASNCGTEAVFMKSGGQGGWTMLASLRS